MYLKKIRFKNYGPLKAAEINPRFFENGNPVPIALVGVNGAGKTLVLSSILDGLVKIRTNIYSESTDVETGKLFKPLKHSIRSNNTSHFTEARSEYVVDENEFTFSEIISDSKDGAVFKLPEGYEAPPDFDKQRFEALGLSKTLSNIEQTDHNKIKRVVAAYFPAGRAEIPGWVGPNTKIDFNIQPRYSDQAGHSIWRINLVNEISQWLLDIVLDCELYDKQTLKVDYGGKLIDASIPTLGRNRRLLQHLNSILTEILRNNAESFVSARFTISERQLGNRTVSVNAKRDDGTEVVIANQLQDLSSGELMAFCLFSDLIRMAEVQGWNRENIADIKGIVLIDEIDLHLHIRLQKEVLPRLIKQMPKVQFIFSTHSPFLILGIAEDDVDIVNMPTATLIDASEFSEFGVAYDSFIEQNEGFKVQYETLKEKLSKMERIIVVTEGKTDWKHLRHALGKFQGDNEFTELDIDFYETPKNMGDGELKKLFGSLEKFPPTFPVICLFDRDQKNIVRDFTDNDEGYVISGKVAATCLVVPEHRSDTPDISIEHLYSDDALATSLEGTEKRLRYRHEIAFKSDKKTAFITDTPDVKSIEIYDSNVVELAKQDGTQKGNLAISKSVFADEIALSDIGTNFDLDGFRPTLKKLRDIHAALSAGLHLQ